MLPRSEQVATAFSTWPRCLFLRVILWCVSLFSSSFSSASNCSFLRMLVNSGHFAFPIYSRLKSPLLSYSFTWGISPNRTEFLRMVAEFADRCDDKGFALASADPECWHELRMTSVVTPISEFEHQLLLAMEAIGAPQAHRGSPIELLHGVPEGRPPNLVPEGYYRNNSWQLCPPTSSCTQAAAAAATGSKGRTEPETGAQTEPVQDTTTR